MCKLIPCLILAPLASITLAAVFMFVWLSDSTADGEPRTAPVLSTDAGQPDDILLENPRAFALAAGAWITKVQLPLPSDAQMEELAKSNPLAFLK